MLNVKYDFIKELLNELSEKSVVKKFRKGKRVFIKSPDPGPIGK
jgi:predicted transcriptional regulator